jgi:hypothetical protein
LVWVDDSIKDRAKTVDQDFGDDFVDGVTKADWSRVSVGFGGLHLGDEGNEGIRDGWVKVSCGKG